MGGLMLNFDYPIFRIRATPQKFHGIKKIAFKYNYWVQGKLLMNKRKSKNLVDCRLIYI
jgi:hypothetical protein